MLVAIPHHERFGGNFFMNKMYGYIRTSTPDQSIRNYTLKGKKKKFLRGRRQRFWAFITQHFWIGREITAKSWRATRLGVTKQAVSRWELGQTYPELHYLPQISEIKNLEQFLFQKDEYLWKSGELFGNYIDWKYEVMQEEIITGEKYKNFVVSRKM